MTSSAFAQDIPPYRQWAEQQICTPTQIHDAPGGLVTGQVPAGSTITVDGIGYDAHGVLYYRLGDTAPAGFVAASDVRNFCDYAARSQPGAPRFQALPNNCHLIAASRKTLGEVNAFAAEYADFLPTMSVYRSGNGWYAVSLGQVSLAAAPSVLANSDRIPDDSYCSDGAAYVAAMDLRDGRFVDPVADPSKNELRQSCLTGDTAACRNHANTLAANSKRTDAQEAELLRFLFLGCMAGRAEDCEQATVVPAKIIAHAMLTAWPAVSVNRTIQLGDLFRIGCDARLVMACRYISANTIRQSSTGRGRFGSAVQAAIVACRTQDRYKCRDIFDLLDKWAGVMGQPPGVNDLFFLAGIRAEACKSSPDPEDRSCQGVDRAYSAVLDRPEASREQQAVSSGHLRARCDLGLVQACVLYAGHPDLLSEAERSRAARQAIAACAASGDDSQVCGRLDSELGAELPETRQLVQDEFRKYADACQAGNTVEAEEACSRSLSYFAEMISATEIAPLEKVLQAACTPDLYSGCDTLAFVYSEFSMTGENLDFLGTGQPEKRLAALRTGCRPGRLGLENCNDLGEALARQGDQPAAQAAYRMACDTIRQDHGDDSFIRTNGSCFEAGLHALRKLDDRETARADFEYVCNSRDDSNRPYACKHLALLDIDEGKAEKDPRPVLEMLTRACFPTGGLRGDGEGCLYLGRTLLQMRDRLGWYEYEGEMILDPAEGPGERDLIRTANAASYAFANGCLSQWQASCAANDKLVADWIAGAYPHEATLCQIRDKNGRITSEKACDLISYAVPVDGPADDDVTVTGLLYLWPDGERTLVTTGEREPTLNGREAAFYGSDDDSMICQQNPETANSFCTTNSAEEEY